MRFVAKILVPLLCGGVVVMNLPALVAVNPAYEPAGWRVFLALALGIIVPLMWCERA